MTADAVTRDTVTRSKWDSAAKSFDYLAFADDRRFAPFKRRHFSKIVGETLLVAAGTGNDFKFFPPGHHIVGIDISPKMLERAARKAGEYDGTIELREMDVCALDCPDDSFDTIATVCTFCSVPRPVDGLRELNQSVSENLALQHRTICDAICARRPEEARTAMQTHIDYVRSRFDAEDD